jgi:uncharacterized delta-60 repeat protein
VNGVYRPGFARLLPDGSLDEGFGASVSAEYRGATDAVVALARQTDGRIFIGGRFASVHGVARCGVARLNVDGSLDRTYLEGKSGICKPGEGTTGWVGDIALQPDGRLIIVGAFSLFNSSPVDGVLRLLANGGVDTTFKAHPLKTLEAGSAMAVALESDGDILIGGNFSVERGAARTGVLRLKANGALDTSFAKDLLGAELVSDILVQRDGRIVLGGGFSSVNGTPVWGVARLLQNGSTDLSFAERQTVVYHGVSSLASSPDGGVILVGEFMTGNGAPRNGVSRTHAVTEKIAIKRVGAKVYARELVNIPKGYKVVALRVDRSSRQVCAASGTRLRLLAPGLCTVRLDLRKGSKVRKLTGSLYAA